MQIMKNIETQSLNNLKNFSITLFANAHGQRSRFVHMEPAHNTIKDYLLAGGVMWLIPTAPGQVVQDNVQLASPAMAKITALRFVLSHTVL